ncbi:YbaB/EbfC family nucleoid-associated protein [Magnetovibrio blakemorei]|jgi:DNA-binding YbaB/EbfC family protein|uniref:Nucleoid-associated protein BEN30_04085 n=1 Tax=Magnetovibrio blakemorei TaxID=28181 RepID=A0A1E5QB75_9PROT|nr:YbaB/EbfC family nucleoid-associated protein [Magnetovibrio blakemorei]OEJ69268.1 nucleoid-associated protein [Magnetovibrio blakemorei]
MKNLGQMMKQAQQMQTRMSEMQEEMEAHEVEGVSGGGLVVVRVNGKFDVRGVSIDPALIDPSDPEMLEDLVAAAINDAKQKIDVFKQEKVAEMTGGLPLPPGFKLPF